MTFYILFYISILLISQFVAKGNEDVGVGLG